VNGDAMNAELETGREFGQCLVGAPAASEAVGDNPDMVTAIGLSMSEIENVTENPADGRAYRMQDTERLIWLRWHGQSRRSPTGVWRGAGIGPMNGMMIEPSASASAASGW
jgi:hypothetical protein